MSTVTRLMPPLPTPLPQQDIINKIVQAASKPVRMKVSSIQESTIAFLGKLTEREEILTSAIAQYCELCVLSEENITSAQGSVDLITEALDKAMRPTPQAPEEQETSEPSAPEAAE